MNAEELERRALKLCDEATAMVKRARGSLVDAKRLVVDMEENLRRAVDSRNEAVRTLQEVREHARKEEK